MKQKYIGKPKDILIQIVVLRQYNFERSNFCMHFFCGKIIIQTEEVRPAFGSLPKPFIIGVCVSQRLCCAFAIGNNTCRDLHSVVWCGIKPWCIRYIKSSKQVRFPYALHSVDGIIRSVTFPDNHDGINIKQLQNKSKGVSNA